MDKKVLKTMRRECDRTMRPCRAFGCFETLLSFVVPTLAAVLIGNMADSLLALNAAAIHDRMLPFFTAVAMEAVLLPLLKMTDSLLLVRCGGKYQTQLMRRILHRPLTALHNETGAAVAEHIMEHAPYYYFIRISKRTLPITAAFYGCTLVYVLIAAKIPAAFAAAVLLLAGLPLVRTDVFGRLSARLAALERDYESERAREEEAMFEARSFYRLNGLTEACVRSFGERFAKWYRSVGRKKQLLEAAETVFGYICDYGAALGVIFAGSVLVLTGRMDVGALMTGYLLLPTLTGFYAAAAEKTEDIQKEKEMQSRLTAFYGTEADELADAEGEMPAAVRGVSEIHLDHVTFAYPGSERPVLENICMTLSAGDRIRLEGGNGSGKSTLARIISGLYAPSGGSLTDENGSQLSKETLRRLVTLREQD